MAERVRKNETGIQNKEFKVRLASLLLLATLTDPPLVVPSTRGLDRPSGPQRHLDLREYNARSQRGPVDLPSHPQFTNGMPTGGLGAFSNIIILKHFPHSKLHLTHSSFSLHLSKEIPICHFTSLHHPFLLHLQYPRHFFPYPLRFSPQVSIFCFPNEGISPPSSLSLASAAIRASGYPQFH